MTNIISDKDFTAFSEEELIKLADLIENKDKNSIFDVEYADGILNIIFFENGQTYVINKHSASKKIWFSSPITGFIVEILVGYKRSGSSNQYILSDKCWQSFNDSGGRLLK